VFETRVGWWAGAQLPKLGEASWSTSRMRKSQKTPTRIVISCLFVFFSPPWGLKRSTRINKWSSVFFADHFWAFYQPFFSTSPVAFVRNSAGFRVVRSWSWCWRGIPWVAASVRRGARGVRSRSPGDHFLQWQNIDDFLGKMVISWDLT